MTLEIIAEAIKGGRTTLSENESKEILKHYHIPVTKEFTVADSDGLRDAAEQIGFPLVLKGCGAQLSHKTERNLVRVGIQSEAEALNVFQELYASIRDEQGEVLVQEMVQGRRELVVGLIRDDQFGPCVMFGLGGIMTEVLKDVVFRPAPLTKAQALRMIDSIRAKKILGSTRGMPAVDKDQLAEILMNIGKIGLEQEQVKEIDINPIIIDESRPVAVDALVVLNS